MTLRFSVVLLVALALSTAAFAQDDDDLAPLAPMGKPKPKPRPKPKPKPVKSRPSPVIDDDLEIAVIAGMKCGNLFFLA